MSVSKQKLQRFIDLQLFEIDQLNQSHQITAARAEAHRIYTLLDYYLSEGKFDE
ncbi:hypothetical protein [Litchfieldia alkalitelluris]|uniref:hypothetical protein n=1 Tax=Litchfieldia alkalitelluris TaxID=304268 RepID=UPI00147394C2|nr:hypothetical protein [Litchfieldia alkalitelluris]